MTEQPTRCPECGAAMRDGLSCREQYEAVLALEYENPVAFGAVHHLTVPAYSVQHPSGYTPEAIDWMLNLLEGFLEQGVSPGAMREQNRDSMDSGQRSFKLTRPPAPPKLVEWPLTINSVYGVGLDVYAGRVRAWAQAALDFARARRQGR